MQTMIKQNILEAAIYQFNSVERFDPTEAKKP
jgi:hypothetical protein